MSKSANHFYCQGNRCQHVLKLWWLMVYLWKKSSPISILGSWYPPTCLGATMCLMSAPGTGNTWACSTAAFIMVLILTHWGCCHHVQGRLIPVLQLYCVTAAQPPKNSHFRAKCELAIQLSCMEFGSRCKLNVVDVIRICWSMHPRSESNTWGFILKEYSCHLFILCVLIGTAIS